MTQAMEQLTGLMPTDIDHVNAHATGTTVGDVAEGRPSTMRWVATSRRSTRAQGGAGPFGQAVGAVEAILTVMAKRDGVIRPP